MSKPWRLLDTGIRPIAENMALDQVILTARSQDQVPDTLRFLQFSPHCVTVGYHQDIDLEVEQEYCRQHGIEINRRITGGGNLYLDAGQLGWEIFAVKGLPGIPQRLEELYGRICEGVVRGLYKLGVKARFRPKNDIEVNGRKISGSGGTEAGNAFLYHGTLLTDFDVDTMLRCLKLPVQKLEDKQVRSFKQRVTCLKEVLGYVPAMSTVKNALAQGIAEELGVELKPGLLTDYESRLLQQKELPRFRSEAWIRGQRVGCQDSRLSTADYKAPGGLIRVSILLDNTRDIIKSVFISGDFFAYPRRSIMDLEAALKNTSSRATELDFTIRNFFDNHQVEIPGITPEDFYHALRRAILQASREGVEAM